MLKSPIHFYWFSVHEKNIVQVECFLEKKENRITPSSQHLVETKQKRGKKMDPVNFPDAVSSRHQASGPATIYN